MVKKLFVLIVGLSVYFVPMLVFHHAYHYQQGVAVWALLGWMVAMAISVFLYEE